MIDENAIPRFKRGVKFRFDDVRGQWTLLAPEKLFQPDEIMAEILKLVDGERSIATIVNALSVRFDAPRELIADDVGKTLQDLSTRGALSL